MILFCLLGSLSYSSCPPRWKRRHRSPSCLKNFWLLGGWETFYPMLLYDWMIEFLLCIRYSFKHVQRRLSWPTSFVYSLNTEKRELGPVHSFNSFSDLKFAMHLASWEEYCDYLEKILALKEGSSFNFRGAVTEAERMALHSLPVILLSDHIFPRIWVRNGFYRLFCSEKIWVKMKYTAVFTMQLFWL